MKNKMKPKDEKKDQDSNKKDIDTEKLQDESMEIYNLEFEEIPLKKYYAAQSIRKK